MLKSNWLLPTLSTRAHLMPGGFLSGHSLRQLST